MYRNLGEQPQILIQLQDLSNKKNQPPRQPSPPSNNYSNPQQPPKRSNNPPPSNNNNNPPPRSQPQPQIQNNRPNPNQQQSQRQSQQQQPPTNKKPSVNKDGMPTMNVKCKFCTLEQKIAGNAQIYICGVCENMNECEPKFNIFICCGCKIKVIYPLNTSDRIKCTRCRMVNLVPKTVKPVPQTYVNQNRQMSGGNNQYNNGYQQQGGQYGNQNRNSNPYGNNGLNNSQQNEPYLQNNNNSTYPPSGFGNSGYVPPKPQNNNNNEPPPYVAQGQTWENYEDFEKLEKMEKDNLKKLGVNLQEGEFIFLGEQNKEREEQKKQIRDEEKQKEKQEKKIQKQIEKEQKSLNVNQFDEFFAVPQIESYSTEKLSIKKPNISYPNLDDNNNL